MLILPKQTPYYSLSPNKLNAFNLGYDGIQYLESDIYLYELDFNPIRNVKYTELSKNDKVYFSKNIKFPLLTINRLNYLPLKKVNNKFDKVIVDTGNCNLSHCYYIIKYNGIYY